MTTSQPDLDRSSERLERATHRYLRVVKDALLDAHYLDHEVRIAHLADRVATGRPPDALALRDPVRHDQSTQRRLERQRFGPAGPNIAASRSFLPYTAMGRARLDHLERCLDVVRTERVPGDLAECGTGRGGGAMFLRAYLEGHEIPDRTVWVADRFRAADAGADAPELTAAGVAAFRADLNLVRDGFARFDLLDERVRFLQGPMHVSLVDAPIEELALLHVGVRAGAQAGTVLARLYDRVAVGGFVIVDEYSQERCREQVDAFRLERGITAPLEAVDASAVAWRVGARDRAAAAPPLATTGATPRTPLAPPAPVDSIDLTVVVVFYNMRREAVRTLQSLSRAYQEGVEDLSYEVVVVENGSAEDEKLGAPAVAAFGPEFRYVDLGPDADPSPVVALNHGIRIGRGNAFALMIDGAHVLTPGVLRFGMAGLRTYAPAIVATQQWYVGPGQQGDAMDDGYDQAYEDRLFEQIRWPSAGHRLFEIGHFVGDRDWLDGVWESNCLFAPRELLEQSGCFDESFSIAGGGYANLDLYERLGTAPGVTVATILGEGSFHQLHGGTTTNQPDAAERRARVFGYSETYAELRGRPFKGPGKPIHFVGRIQSAAARRTKPRRQSAESFAAAARFDDGRPESPTPVPDELRWSFTEAVWRSLPWDHTTWLGRRVTSAPTDLLAYQEVIAAVRPDWVIEAGTGDGGRGLFLASICELVDHGRVVSIGDDAHGGHGDGGGNDDPDERPRHPRLQHLSGPPWDPIRVEQVRELVGEGTALVVLGSAAHRDLVKRAFEAYAPLVPVGSYVVVTETIVNGHPVWPAFGPGPAEALKQLLRRHGQFVPDPLMEKYSLTFNPRGWLRRVR